MNKSRSLFAACLISPALFFSAGSAHAVAVVNFSLAELGFGFFDIETIGDVDYRFIETIGDVDYRFEEDFWAGSYAYARDDNEADEDLGVFDGELGESGAVADTENSFGFAGASVEEGGAFEVTGAAADGVSTTEAWAEAKAWVEGELIVEGDGFILLSAEYWLEQELSTTEVGDIAKAYSEAGFWYKGEGSSGNSMAYLENSLTDGDAGDWEELGALALAIQVGTLNGEQNGEETFNIGGYVYNSAYAYSPEKAQVPEPSILALLSLGLLGIGAARKLKKH